MTACALALQNNFRVVVAWSYIRDRTFALLKELEQLEGAPEAETATFKRVLQAKRHPLWRIAHPYEPNIAVRIIFWFESDRLVIALVGFNKAKLGDVWSTSAAIREQALVDQWRRTHQAHTEGTT